MMNDTARSMMLIDLESPTPTYAIAAFGDKTGFSNNMAGLISSK